MKSLFRLCLVCLLALSMPAQSLVLAMLECEQHLAMSSQQFSAPAFQQSADHHASQIVAAEPDCHGVTQSGNTRTDTTDNSAESRHSTSSCAHCSSACQSPKPLSLLNTAQPLAAGHKNHFSNLAEAPLSGVSSEPSRPPCRSFLS